MIKLNQSADLPDRAIWSFGCLVLFAKIFPFPPDAITSISFPYRAYRDHHGRRVGCGAKTAVPQIKLTARKIMPYRWVHPDEER
jgi:hypothetical protein